MMQYKLEQQVEFLQKKNNRLENESESLLKIIKLLSVQQIKYLSNQRQHRKIYCS